MADVSISGAGALSGAGIVRLPASKGPFSPGTKGYLQHNFAATTAPAVGDDDADGYAAGSLWYDTTGNNLYICKSAATGAAVWLLVADADQAALGALTPSNDDILQRKAGVWTNRTMAQLSADVDAAVPHSRVLWSLTGADMNVTTDQAFTKHGTFTNYLITEVRVVNASISLTTAAGGIYPSASKSGSALVGAGQAYSTLTGSTSGLSATRSTPGNGKRSDSNLFLSLTTPQGGAATADFYIIGTPIA